MHSANAEPVAGSDALAVDWAKVDVPPSWADTDLATPWGFFRMMRRLLGPRRRVELAPDMPGAALMPEYLLQEFHHLPNGNFSSFFADGYLWAFDATMLGLSRQMRTAMAERLKDRKSVLDIGCSGADLAAAIKKAGVDDVVGLDASPYMLKHAARRNPGIPLVQGLAEKTDFPDGRFDAVAACFLFHELPWATQDEVLRETRRILAPGGLLVICEPAPENMYESIWTLMRKKGLLGLWWKMIATVAHEPFVEDWHRRKPEPWFTAHGFELVESTTDIPFRTLVARRE